MGYHIMQGNNKFCMVKTDVELSEDQDMFAKFDNASVNWKDDDFDCSGSVSMEMNGNKFCKNVTASKSDSGNKNKANETEKVNNGEDAEGEDAEGEDAEGEDAEGE